MRLNSLILIDDFISPLYTKHNKRNEVYIQTARYSCPTLTKSGVSRRIFVKVSNVKFNENPSSDTCGQTGKYEDSNSRFSLTL